MHVPKPHYVPKHELRWRVDAGQVSRIDFEKGVDALCLSEEQNIIAFAQGDEIHVFDLQAMCTVQTLKSNSDWIRSVAMSGDGSRIVSGCNEEIVRVWDWQSGECVLGPLCGHDNWVQCVAMSRDGSRIGSGSLDKTVRVWDGESGECVLGPLRGHEDGVRYLAMSGDGSRIVTGSEDKTVRVWDGESGECVLGPLRGHEFAVVGVAMSGDGSRIVSGSLDKAVRVWDGESGERVLGPLRGHEDYVRCVTMSWDGSRIVSGCADGTVRVWDGQSGACVKDEITGRGEIRSLEFDDGSDLCVVRTSREVFLLDTRTGTKMQCPGYIIEGDNGKMYATGQNAKTHVATMPFECVTFCYNKLHSRAAVGLSDGQVFIGDILL